MNKEKFKRVRKNKYRGGVRRALDRQGQVLHMFSSSCVVVRKRNDGPGSSDTLPSPGVAVHGGLALCAQALCHPKSGAPASSAGTSSLQGCELYAWVLPTFNLLKGEQRRHFLPRPLAQKLPDLFSFLKFEVHEAIFIQVIAR